MEEQLQLVALHDVLVAECHEHTVLAARLVRLVSSILCGLIDAGGAPAQRREDDGEVHVVLCRPPVRAELDRVSPDSNEMGERTALSDEEECAPRFDLLSAGDREAGSVRVGAEHCVADLQASRARSGPHVDGVEEAAFEVAALSRVTS